MKIQTVQRGQGSSDHSALRLTVMALTASTLLFGSTLVQARSSAVDTLPQAMVDELIQLVNRAETERSADRRFIEDLRQFIDQHDRPWTRVVLSEQFADGNFTRAPTWQVVRGEFFVDRRYGLFSEAARRPSSAQQQSNNSQSSRRDPGADLAAALIGSLLQQKLGSKQQSQQNTQQQKPAAVPDPRIETTITSGNAFSLDVDLSNVSDGASALLGLHAAAGDDTGYQLVLTPGPRGAVELLRISSRGTTVVDSYRRGVEADQQGYHRLNWSRGRSGTMRVTHNGVEVLRTSDRGLVGGFKRLSIVNENGRLGVKKVELRSTP